MGFLQDAISEARIVSNKELNESWVQDVKDTAKYLWTWSRGNDLGEVARDLYTEAEDLVSDKIDEKSVEFYETIRKVFNDNLDKYYEELQKNVAEIVENGYTIGKEKVNAAIDERIKRLGNE